MEDLRQIVGSNIRYYRQSKQLTQECLAEKVDVSCSYIGYLERGKKSPSLELLSRIALCLEVEPFMLLTPLMDDHYPLNSLLAFLNGKPPATISFLQEVAVAYYRAVGEEE